MLERLGLARLILQCLIIQRLSLQRIILQRLGERTTLERIPLRGLSLKAVEDSTSTTLLSAVVELWLGCTITSRGSEGMVVFNVLRS